MGEMSIDILRDLASNQASISILKLTSSLSDSLIATSSFK